LKRKNSFLFKKICVIFLGDKVQNDKRIISFFDNFPIKFQARCSSNNGFKDESKHDEFGKKWKQQVFRYESF
jgi:hypothetical protein